jgi:hypothetical protein
MKKIKLPETIVINSTKLESLILDYGKDVKGQFGWPVPAAFLFSVILCIPVSEFKATWGLTADQIKILVYLAGIASLIWTCFELRQIFKTSPHSSFVKNLADSIKNTPDFTVMYLIKLTKDQIPRILVEKNNTWKCYFLPYVSRSPADLFSTEKLDELTRTISAFLGISSDGVTIDHLREYGLISEKYSQSDQVQKQFNFDFFFFSVPADKMLENYDISPFAVGGKTFYWMTLDELQNEPPWNKTATYWPICKGTTLLSLPPRRILFAKWI